MATTQPIRCKKQTNQLAEYFKKLGQVRNYVITTIGLHTALRISDVLRIKWDDVYDFDTGKIIATFEITEKKTGKSKTVTIGRSTIAALTKFAKENANPGKYLFENPRTAKPITRIQVYRILRNAAEALRFSIRVSCHSLRKTFGYHAFKSGASPIVLMDIFNHSSFEITKRYIGISQDDKDAVYLSMELVA